jgi:Leucine-rich repeat (LRR) protein
MYIIYYCRLGSLHKLEELDLEGNNFSAGLPPVVGKLTTLKSLDLERCKLINIPDE